MINIRIFMSYYNINWIGFYKYVFTKEIKNFVNNNFYVYRQDLIYTISVNLLNSFIKNINFNLTNNKYYLNFFFFTHLNE